MTYALIQNNIVVEYPVYEGDIRLRFSNTSFASPFQPPEGYVFVKDAFQPTIDYTQNITEGTPQLIDGVWTRVWNVSKASDSEISERRQYQWDRIRVERNTKLLQSDWTRLDDAPLTEAKKLEWAAYRQALRDVTDQTDPFAIIWPTKPE